MLFFRFPTTAFVASIPGPATGSVSVGSLEIRAYGLMIALGVIADPAHSVGELRLNQWVALGAVLAGAIYLLATRGRKWDESRLTMEPHGVAEEST